MLITIVILSLCSSMFIGIDPNLVNENLDNNFVLFSSKQPVNRVKRDSDNNNFIPNCKTVTSWKWIMNSDAIKDVGTLYKDLNSSILLGTIDHKGVSYKQYVKEITCTGYNSTKCLGTDESRWLSYCEQIVTSVNVSTYKDNSKGLLSLNVHSGCRCMVKEKYISNRANKIKKNSGR
ncbi:beta-ngf-like protein [Albatrosspox virus]|nr:beta-ngf-like protein [Penguinpox virus 2]QRM16248.1 beta-ngf-like protein [Albatrosspox virus]